MEQHHLYDLLDDYLSQLDNVTVLESEIFKTEIDKEWYETRLMYAFEKYKASKYHLNNVCELMDKDTQTVKDALKNYFMKDTLKGFKYAESTICASMMKNEYAYELCAFLSALRASIDFVCQVCYYHIPGVNGDSFSNIYKALKKNDLGGQFMMNFKSTYLG